MPSRSGKKKTKEMMEGEAISGGLLLQRHQTKMDFTFCLMMSTVKKSIRICWEGTLYTLTLEKLMVIGIS